MKHKNILLILPDQLRADFLGCYGAKFAKTSNIDQLARESVIYDRCISPSPLCVPARASLLTGENAIVNNVLHNGAWLRPDHEECGLHSWPKVLSDNGYHTVAIGKMHFYPWDLKEGFQRRIICEDKRHIQINDDYANELAKHGLKKYHGKDCEGYLENKGSCFNPLPKELQGDTWITNQACQYIENYDEELPFAMMVGLVSPHCPYDPHREDVVEFDEVEMPEPFEQKDEDKKLFEKQLQSCLGDWCGIDYTKFSKKQIETMRKHYSALIHHIDTCVGKLIQVLKDKGIYDDTVIIFSSDHGDLVGDYGMVGKRVFYEPSIRVPLIIKDNQLVTQGHDDTLVSLTDVRSVILYAAGIKNYETQDSKLPPCYGTRLKERYIFGADDVGFMLTNKDYKYCRYHNGQIQLFDLTIDQNENKNRAKELKYKKVLEYFDVFFQKEILRSIIQGTKHTNVDVTSQAFNQKNWIRPYPYKL